MGNLLEDRIFTSGYVPDGLHNDLIDDHADTNGVIDDVFGFTNNQIFSSIPSDVHTIEEFRDRLIDNHLGVTTNTQLQVIDLFNSY